jgi:hypothetical protein
MVLIIFEELTPVTLTCELYTWFYEKNFILDSMKLITNSKILQ